MNMFPVNCHLLGEAILRQSRDTMLEPEKLDQDEKLDHDRASRSTLATIVAMSKGYLSKLENAKQMIDVEVGESCTEEAATSLSSHFAGCHAQLELVGDKIKKTLGQEEEKRMIQDFDMTRDLLDIIDKPAASENDVQLVIDENIYSALETHLKFETVDLVINPNVSPAHEPFKDSVVTIIESEEDSVIDTEEASVVNLKPLSHALILRSLNVLK